MKKWLLSLFIFLCFIQPLSAANFQEGFDSGKLPAGGVTVDCSAFSLNLSCADTNVQHALNTIDQLVIGGGSGSGNVAPGTAGAFAGYNVGIASVGPFQTVEIAGNVGIGSAHPGFKLDVTGGGRFSSSITTAGISNAGAAITTDNAYTQSGSSANTFSGTSSFTAAGDSIITTGELGVGITPTQQVHAQRDQNNPTIMRVENDTDNTNASAYVSAKSGALEMTMRMFPSLYSGVPSWAGKGVIRPDADLVLATSTNTIFQNGALGNQTAILTTGGNLGIGSASPGKTLDVTGNIRLSGTISTPLTINQCVQTSSIGDLSTSGTACPTVTVNPGTAFAPAVFSGTTTIGASTKMFDNGTNIGIGTVAPLAAVDLARSLFIPSLGGNVGIGSQIVGAFLEVRKDQNAATLSSVNNQRVGTLAYAGFIANGLGKSVQLLDVSSSTNSLGQTVKGNAVLYASSQNLFLNVDSGLDIRIENGLSTQTAVFKDGGNVGIGTAGPTGLFEVGTKLFNIQSGGNIGVGTATPQAQLVVLNGNVGIGTWTANGGRLIISGGNVGIGTITPGAALDITGRMRQSTAPTLCSAGNYPLGVDGSLNAVSCTAAGGGSSQWITTSGIGIGTYDAVGIGTVNPQAKLSVVSGNVGIGTWVATKALCVGPACAGSIDVSGNGILAGTVSVTGHTTFEGVTSTGATGTGKIVYDGTPTLVTPVIGAATGTSLALSGNIGVGGGGVATNPLQVTGNGAFTGNVGISTTLLNNVLAVKGGVSIGDTYAGVSVTTGNLAVKTNVGIGTYAPQFALAVGSTGGVNISSGGNVGIGTTANQAPLSVMSGNVGIGTYAPVASFQVVGTGNVGIGTVNPGVSLDIFGSAGSARVRVVGIGTTVPQAACIKADGTMGYYTTTTFAGTCL